MSFVRGGRKLKEITYDGFSFLTDGRGLGYFAECDESGSESLILTHSFRNWKDSVAWRVLLCLT